jgi:hypothetical protein
MATGSSNYKPRPPLDNALEQQFKEGGGLLPSISQFVHLTQMEGDSVLLLFNSWHMLYEGKYLAMLFMSHEYPQWALYFPEPSIK